MNLVHRVLHPNPIASLDAYISARGGGGLRVARRLDPDDIIEELSRSGLRGRGGAGFPTGRKWRKVRDNASQILPTSVVVNAAEGEPGTYKDRTILRNNPYQVIEGALIAARAVDADQIVIATKRAFATEVARLRSAVGEIRRAGWADGVDITVFEGPSEYLYGEETALLETIDGRYPFPRVAPPYRRGLREVVTTDAALRSRSGLSASVQLAGPADHLLAPPALVDNVETLANVPRILARGASWFRTLGTESSPGTIVCTVTGSTRRAGVGEVMMGTPLRDAIELIGGGARDGRKIVGVLPGVSNGIIAEQNIDEPISYESLARIGSGLGSAGFIVLDDTDDMVAVAAGVSRFLAVESCGQCTPCKLGGQKIAALLAKLSRSDASSSDLRVLRSCLGAVSYGARCSLAGQQQAVVSSLLDGYPEAVSAHLRRRARAAEPVLIAELVELRDGRAVIDERQLEKQPDWTFNAVPSRKTPAARLGEHRTPERLDRAKPA